MELNERAVNRFRNCEASPKRGQECSPIVSCKISAADIILGVKVRQNSGDVADVAQEVSIRAIAGCIISVAAHFIHVLPHRREYIKELSDGAS